jgi:hypothetical protein
MIILLVIISRFVDMGLEAINAFNVRDFFGCYPRYLAMGLIVLIGACFLFTTKL